MKRTLFIALAVVVSASFCMAGYTDKGTIEAGGSATYLTNENTNVLTLAPSFDYFIKENVSLGGSFSYVKVKDVDGTSELIFSPKYYFQSGRPQYFTYATVLIDFIKDDTALGIGGGVKFKFISSKSHLNVGFTWVFNDVKDKTLFTGITVYQ